MDKIEFVLIIIEFICIAIQMILSIYEIYLEKQSSKDMIRIRKDIKNGN